MLKTAGIFLIIFAGTGLGFCKSMELTRRERALKEILRMVILLKGEIRYGCASLSDAFTGAAGKMAGDYRAFLIYTAKAMGNGTGKPFGEIFRECAEEYLRGLGLGQEEREQLFSLGEHLGYLDISMQMKQLTLYEEELSEHIRTLQEKIPGKKKVYQSLGILGGILLAVLVW